MTNTGIFTRFFDKLKFIALRFHCKSNIFGVTCKFGIKIGWSLRGITAPERVKHENYALEMLCFCITIHKFWIHIINLNIYTFHNLCTKLK